MWFPAKNAFYRESCSWQRSSWSMDIKNTHRLSAHKYVNDMQWNSSGLKKSNPQLLWWHNFLKSVFLITQFWRSAICDVTRGTDANVVLKPPAKRDSTWQMPYYQGTLHFDIWYDPDISNLMISTYQYQSDISTRQMKHTSMTYFVAGSVRNTATSDATQTENSSRP